MTATPPFPELLTLIDERSAVFAAAAAAAPDLSARVPGCPQWSLRDLVAHLGGVQRFWALSVAAGPSDAPPQVDRAALGPQGDDLLGWFAESTGTLLSALRAADPATQCWAWWPASAAPRTVGSIARHQVQEAAVHAVDAQQVAGEAQPLPAAVAVDGVAEFLEVCLGSRGEWPHRPARLLFRATEGPTWTVDLSPAGVVVGPAAAGEPVTTISGPAGDLVLTLYGRTPIGDVRVDGDPSVAAELGEWSRMD